MRSDEVFSTLGRSILADGYDMVLDVEKSQGSRLYDSKSQRFMIDFFSFFASNPIGLNHPRMHEKEFEDKLVKFGRVKVSNSDIYTTAYAEFVESFHKNCAPMFDRLFFIDGGALGVENAIKTAQDWKVRKNIKAGKGEKGTQVIHFKEAFHGRTGYTLSLTNTAPEKTLYFPKFDWPRIINPKLTFPLNPQGIQATMDVEKQAVDQIKMAFRDRKDDICAIILETIQGEGGDNMFRAEFLQRLRELADENDVMLIFDEVQCGMGITGKYWAFEHFNVMPDLISFGKKVQVCGCAARLKRLEEVDHVYKVPSRINSTFGGNLVDMVRTTQYIDIIVKENLLDNTRRMGAYMKKELEQLGAADDRVTNVRGLGLWLAFDLPSPEIRSELMDQCWKNGLIVLACGHQSIRLRPVLNITQDEAEEGLSILRKSLKELKAQPKVSGKTAAR